MSTLKFTAKIVATEKMDAAFVTVPFDIKKEWNRVGHIKIKAWFDGLLYRGLIAKMRKNDSTYFLILVQKVRKEIGKQPGDLVEVVLEQDFEERNVEVPVILKSQFQKNPEAELYFNSLAHSHRKEYVNYINDAKKIETQERRAVKTIEMLSNGWKNPSIKKTTN